jgi:hypothetical protein
MPRIPLKADEGAWGPHSSDRSIAQALGISRSRRPGPKGRARWSPRVPADMRVELEILDETSQGTAWGTYQKRSPALGLR